MRKPSETTPAPQQRVLLINENRNGLVARKSVLMGEGYTVTACDTPGEALSLFTIEVFDLVVTDYSLPGMSGTDLIQVLREQRPGIPVVLVSGMVDVLGLNEQNTGADAVVAKCAFEVSHMVRAVNRLLRKPATPRKPVRSQLGRRMTVRAQSS